MATSDRRRQPQKFVVKIDNLHEKIPKSNLTSPALSETLPDVHPLFVLDELTEKRQAIHGADRLAIKNGVRPLTARQNEPSNAASIMTGDTRTEDRSTLLSPLLSPVLSHEKLSSENPYNDDNKIHLLLGVSGTIGAAKVILLVKKLFALYTHDKLAVKIVMTESALNVLNLQDYCNGAAVENVHRKTNWSRMMELGIERIWTEKSAQEARIAKLSVHLELSKWADLFVIAPLSANTMAKIVNGIASNLLTTIVACWNSQKPIIAALSINNMAYQQSITKIHLDLMAQYFPYIQILRPMEKMIGKAGTSLAGMREWPDIVEVVMKKIGPPSDFDDEDEGDNNNDDANETKTDSEASDEDDEDDLEEADKN